MNKRILFCVETTKQADTDYAYIKDTIDYYFVQSSKITIRPVYMESKSRYKSKAVQEDIKRQSGLADTSVIYCIDTDDYDISPEDRTLLEQIRQYCEKRDMNSYSSAKTWKMFIAAREFRTPRRSKQSNSSEALMPSQRQIRSSWKKNSTSRTAATY